MKEVKFDPLNILSINGAKWKDEDCLDDDVKNFIKNHVAEYVEDYVKIRAEIYVEKSVKKFKKGNIQGYLKYLK